MKIWSDWYCINVVLKQLVFTLYWAPLTLIKDSPSCLCEGRIKRFRIRFNAFIKCEHTCPFFSLLFLLYFLSLKLNWWSTSSIELCVRTHFMDYNFRYLKFIVDLFWVSWGGCIDSDWSRPDMFMSPHSVILLSLLISILHPVCEVTAVSVIVKYRCIEISQK